MPVRPSDVGELVALSRILRAGQVALTIAFVAAAAAVAFALAAASSPVAVRWGTGAVLVVLVAATGLRCAHAGGHALLVPLPVLALAAGWALTASSGSPEAAWWLVALTAVASTSGMVLATTALRHGCRASWLFSRSCGGLAVWP